MEYISAPWRKKYVLNACKMKECIFCRALEINDDKKSHILYRGSHNFIILNKYPYNPGHLMIAPFKHLDSIEKSEKKSTEELMNLLRMTINLLRKHYKPQGFNTGMNIGRCAGAGVVDHYHLHIIPRWVGDSNYMPIIGKTKIVIEDLQTTYDQLLPLFKGEI
jgi:ATP adenylyltransferase